MNKGKNYNMYNLRNLNGITNMNNINNINIINENNTEISNIDSDFIKHIKNGSDNTILIQTFIKNGANVNYTDRDGFTPLLYATSIENNIDIIRVLLSNGADVNTKDRYGNGVLYNATALPNNTNTILLLVEYGTDIHSEKYILHNSFKAKDFEVITYLLEHGADIFEKDEYSLCPFEYGNFEIFKKIRDTYNIKYDITTEFKKDISYYNVVSAHNTTKNNDYIKNLKNLKNKGNTYNTPQSSIIQNLIRQHNEFIKRSSKRETFILKQYTYHGDVIVNKFLRDEDSVLLYKKNLMDLKKKQTSDEQFFIFPYIYSMEDLGMIQYNTNNYIYLFYEEFIYEDVLNNILHNNIDWFRRLSYHYFIDLYKTIQRFPKAESPFILYRGINHNYLKDEKDTKFYLNSFSSCSYKKSVAESFGKILIEFYVHPMCDYVYLESISIVGGEEEILLTPYTRYFIFDVNKDKTVWKIGVLPSDKNIPVYDDFLQFRKNIKSGGNHGAIRIGKKHFTQKNRGIHKGGKKNRNVVHNITCKNRNILRQHKNTTGDIITSRSPDQLRSQADEMIPWKWEKATPEEMVIVKNMVEFVDDYLKIETYI